LPYDDLKALYRVSDIFVYPLLGYGGVAISLLEAMAAGLPLIATNIGGLPTQVRDGWNGFLVEPANEKQLAEKIKYLIDHPEERIKMGINSRKLAEGEFNWDKIAEKYIEVYKKVLSQ
jgi:glycosyltransferase involved in cell wall biosynthesis